MSELMRAHGYSGDPEEFEAWLEQRTRLNMERLGLQTSEEYDIYLRGHADGCEETRNAHARAIQIGRSVIQGWRWAWFAALCTVGLVLALLGLWGYVSLMQITEPWGWSSLLVIPIAAGLVLYLNERSNRRKQNGGDV